MLGSRYDSGRGAACVLATHLALRCRFRDFYLHHRVLYWLLSDDSMLGSQEFAYKALSKEVSNGMQLLAAGVPGVHPLLTTVSETRVLAGSGNGTHSVGRCVGCGLLRTPSLVYCSRAVE